MKNQLNLINHFWSSCSFLPTFHTNKRLGHVVRENLVLIKRNVKRLNYLIEKLPDVRKAESGKLTATLSMEDIVFNSVGAVICDIRVESSIEEIPLQQAPAGLYMIVISDKKCTI